MLDAVALKRSITRLSHEIIESNDGAENLVLVGIHRRGVPLAKRLQALIESHTGVVVPNGSIDITFHRDDYRDRLIMPEVKGSDLTIPVDGKTVVLVDDVLFTGRTIRAAMDALFSFGRPAKIQLAVLVDRGHREIPIKADFVGKNIPTHEGEHVKVLVSEVDGKDAVQLLSYGGNYAGE